MRMSRSLAHAGIGCLAMLAVMACAHAGDPPAAPAAPPTAHAVADMTPTQGSDVKGRVTFTAEKHGVRVVADVTGLTHGEHGFHIHEKGDCSAPDGTSAGAHFNPTGKPHGAPGTVEHHLGDLGNIKADKTGVAHLEISFPHLTLNGPETIVGLGLIIHASPDDMRTQPTGNAGARLACGVIRAQ